MIEQIEAEFFHDFQTKGYSRPARLTCRRADGRQIEVFVKFAGAIRDHYFGLCAEALCSSLARQLGFLTPDPYIVNLSPEFLAGAPKEAKDIISRSMGLNFGTAAVGEGYSVMQTAPRLSPELRQTATEIYAFDIMVQNYDRKKDNPNLLWNGKRIVLIDHESALNSILKWADLRLDNLDLDKFYDHVFWDSPANADFQRLADALQTLTPPVLHGFFKQLPDVWRDEIALSKISEYLNFLVDNRRAVCDIVEQRIS